MSRKSEFDKPFAVDGLRHLLKDFDAAGVVFDEVVVVAEDSRRFCVVLRDYGFSIRDYQDGFDSMLGQLPQNHNVATSEFVGNSRHILEYFP